ncbi:hypothetical protein TWF281_011102 [Arthrobotrys megalospora]
MPRQKTVWCETLNQYLVHDTSQEEADHEEDCPTCQQTMSDYRQNENSMVRGHYGFVRRQGPPVQREIPVWHGPIRVRRPVRTVVWWEKRDPKEPSDDFEEINLQGETVPTGEQFLHRLFAEPDPIACGVACHLNVADLNSLKYTCKSFNMALSGEGAWAWMITTLTFGNELEGDADAFNGLRRLTDRLPFWDTISVQGIISLFDIRDILVNVNLAYTAVDASCIDWLLNNFRSVRRISVRYCRYFKLGPFLKILEDYAENGKEAKKRLENMFFDYWFVSEIHSVVGTMLVDQALTDEATDVANKIRCISKLIESNVFLCYRNHYEEGLWGPDKLQFRETHGEGACTSADGVSDACQQMSALIAMSTIACLVIPVLMRYRLARATLSPLPVSMNTSPAVPTSPPLGTSSTTSMNNARSVLGFSKSANCARSSSAGTFPDSTAPAVVAANALTLLPTACVCVSFVKLTMRIVPRLGLFPPELHIFIQGIDSG